MILRKRNKKGAVAAFIGLITGVGVAVLLLLFTSVLSGQTYNLLGPEINQIGLLSANETVNMSNTTYNKFDHGDILVSTLQVTSGNGTVMYSSSNTSCFTLRAQEGEFLLNSLSGCFMKDDDEIANASYMYGQGDHIKAGILNASLYSFRAQATTAKYTPIYVLAFIIFIILGLIMGLGAITGGKSGSGGVL